ncbi:Uncharacterised protein [uncultured archaeon]|nr:Uncharacterised protein [uncultured archaeon]
MGVHILQMLLGFSFRLVTGKNLAGLVRLDDPWGILALGILMTFDVFDVSNFLHCCRKTREGSEFL